MLPADPEPLELEAIAEPLELEVPSRARRWPIASAPRPPPDLGRRPAGRGRGRWTRTEIPEIALDADAGLADRLWAARETAEAVKSADGRTRAALYRALGLAYDFAVAAEREPQDYAELLEESGMKAQARAPMTPIVKLVFGIDYDKTRLTEFAAALSNAQRNAVPESGFLAFIEGQPGGLKALVAAERQAPPPRAQARHARRRGARSASRRCSRSRSKPRWRRGIRARDDAPRCRWRL